MAEYSRLQSTQVISNGGQTVAIFPATPTFIDMSNQTKATNASAGVNRAWWHADDGQGAAYLTTTSTGTPNTDTTTFITTGGFTTIQAALALQYGPTVLLGTTGGAGIAKTSSTVLTVTTAAAHGLVPGNWVIFQNLYQTSTTGMQQIAGIPFEVLTVGSSTTFTIGWVGNSSNLTAITTAATGAASFKQILYPVLYAPGVCVPWSITTSGVVTTIKTTAPHNFQVGQQIAFRIPPVYGSTQLNSLPDVTIPGQPLYYYVASVTGRDSFTVNNLPSYTAFTVNAPFLSFPGLEFPQIVAVGDVNSGGYPYTGGALYPSPTVYNGYSTSAVNTINGPGIQGAYINASWQGIIIGASISGSAADVLDVRAYLHDYNT